ncbi:PAS domain S-box protein [Bacteroidota bacterium]
MKIKLNFTAKLILYVLIIPFAFYILISLFIKNRFEKSNLNQFIEVEKKYLSKQASINKSNYQLILNQVDNMQILFNSLSNINIETKKNNVDLALKQFFEKSEKITSVWIDWELDYIDSNWYKPYGVERHEFKRFQGETHKDILLLDTINENTDNLHYKCKISKSNYFSEPFSIINNDEKDNDYSTKYIIPVFIDDEFKGSIGIKFKFKYNDYFRNDIKYSFKSYVINNKGIILVSENVDLIGTSIQSLFSSEIIKKHNLNHVIKAKAPINFTAKINDLDHNFLFSFLPVNVIESHSDWLYITSISVNQINLLSKKQYNHVIIIGLVVFTLICVIIIIIGNKYTDVFNKANSAIKNLSFGDINSEYKLIINNKDETGELANHINNLIDNLNTTAKYAKEIGKGNISLEINKLSDKDILSESLSEMKNSLQNAKSEEEKRKAEDDIQNWTSQGHAKFGDILREYTDNLETFTYNILSNLIEYTKATIGGIYLVNEDNNNEKFIELISCFAYDHKKYMQKKFAINEGLVGRVVFEKETIYLTDIPENYIKITSGLGKSKPQSLLLVPLKMHDQVYGAIELASYINFEKHTITFIEKLGSSIASTIANLKINLQTTHLLEDTKQQAEELASQEEEMRQNLEELQATQEESARREAELTSTFTALSSSLLVWEFDLDGKIISMNNDLIKILELKNKDITNENYKNIALSLGVSEEDIESIWNDIKQNKIVKKIIEFKLEEKSIWINQTFAPIMDVKGNVNKVLNIGVDITEMILKEKQVEVLLNETQDKNKALLKAQEETLYEKFLFDTLLENVPQRVFFKDRESKFIRVSKSLLKKVGLEKPEDIIGKSDFDLLKKEFAENTFKDEQNIMKSRKGLINFEEYEKKPDGEEIWKTVSKIPIINKKDECIGLFGIVNDTSEVKKFQNDALEKSKELEEQKEELRQNLEELKATQEESARKEAELTSLFNSINSSFLVAEYNLNGRIISLNKDFSILLKLNEKNIIGKQYKKLAYSRGVSEKEIDQIWEAINKGEIVKKTIKFIVNNEEIWLNKTFAPILDSTGQVCKILNIGNNITEMMLQEKQVEALLNEAKQQNKQLLSAQEETSHEKFLFDTLLENVPQRVFFKNRDSKFIRASKSILKKIGLKSQKELIGKSDFDFLKKEFAEQTFNDEQKIMETRKGLLNFEEYEKKPDGEEIWKTVSKIPMINENNDCIGLFGIVNDISDFKKIEKELNELKKKNS